MRFPIPGARAFVPAALAVTLLITAAPPTPAAAAELSEAAQVINHAKAQLGDPWRYGAAGPYAFDCSGLVIYAYKAAGDLYLIGNGNYRSASSLYKYFRDRGKTSRTTATPGDLVVWGGGTHIGIYLGGGKAISTLTSGVSIHYVNAVTASFTAYLRTGLYQLGTSSTASTVPIRYTNGAVNLRRGPGTEYAVTRVLADRTRLSILGSAKDSGGRTWYKVTSEGGYVASWETTS
ncbi:MAG: C40 family peptidase [Chloroflexi bacterium]|nr:C40 family peptidase [Chloroflexota bacterium]